MLMNTMVWRKFTADTLAFQVEVGELHTSSMLVKHVLIILPGTRAWLRNDNVLEQSWATLGSCSLDSWVHKIGRSL